MVPLCHVLMQLCKFEGKNKWRPMNHVDYVNKFELLIAILFVSRCRCYDIVLEPIVATASTETSEMDYFRAFKYKYSFCNTRNSSIMREWQMNQFIEIIAE
ncbi:hypothetical protein K1719_036042 [Acacia pycnantha]|nr:hypothetical protein K1719_036042 [Acacia pycnantha]